MTLVVKCLLGHPRITVELGPIAVFSTVSDAHTEFWDIVLRVVVIINSVIFVKQISVMDIPSEYVSIHT